MDRVDECDEIDRGCWLDIIHIDGIVTDEVVHEWGKLEWVESHSRREVQIRWTLEKSRKRYREIKLHTLGWSYKITS